MTKWFGSFEGIKQITRMDKPIGTYLLMWPTLWALWVAAEDFPGWHYLLVFTLGVFVMRSAGCVINDYADRRVDGKVKRTSTRPLVSGLITERQAKNLFLLLVSIAFTLVLTLSWQTIALSFVALLLASCYPFMKRYTHLPQVVLGAAFSWGMIMAFMEIRGYIPLEAWLLFAANLVWTVAYDTMYAMVDRDDDVIIGVKSTAVLFGRFDKLVIAVLQLLVLMLLVWVGLRLQFNMFYYLSIAFTAASFIHQHQLIKNRDRDNCFKAFLDNHNGLLFILIGILLQYHEFY
ncbi:4-hydroxybenzoate octaprenyltransferase [Thalassotalea mangrovi]|uniref:4-hydroxybenzoate octaprenyltransferase n=1 Tax=Thalassotalea mangrovi TaxID=2572245 RepID=A0A4V5NUA0_9GAMM|nr:4-hydroxybenzoate octaprenyltransferase [Thalassotalea mangrovi]TKB45515.1 4-hydroxybenzoate octaprenyltransferase [Thalassotalea mangrovi]